MKRVLFAALILLLPGPSSAQQAVTNPHGDFDVGCETCHGAEGWIPVHAEDFDHSTTGFALEGAHEGLACTDCHTDLKFGAAGSDCASCHTDVHLGELGLDCDRCHTTRTFVDLARHRQMHREASFPLTGAHAGADCRDCHVPRPLGGLQYLGTTSECIDCHRDAYESVTSPDHVQGQFAERCDYCHTTASWEGAFFNHERQFGTSNLVCVECHRDDYDGAARPNHVTAGFPLECQVCHNTRSWYGSYFQHDQQYFPIFSGRHANEWNDCVECHTVATDFRVFDCLNCHPHSDKADTDGKHRGEVSNYTYESNACYRCHPRGRGED